MKHIYVDTALLAIPNYAVDPQTAEELFDRIVHLAKINAPGIPITLVLSHDIEQILWGCNCGPSYEQISSFIDIMDLAHIFSANDLFRLYYSVLDHAHRSNDVVPVEVRGYSAFQVNPPLPIGLSPTALRPETERVLATVAAIGLFDESWCVGSAVQGVFGTAFEVLVAIEEATGPNVIDLGPLPVALSRTARLIAHLGELANLEDSRKIWELAETSQDLCLSISLGAFALLAGAGLPASLEALKTFSVGSEFLESLRAHQCDAAGRFSSAAHLLCCQIVAGLCQKRVGIFGRPDQEIRGADGATGWRVHLTKGAAGLRLMYWSSAAGIEFANVGVKGELIIRDGQPRSRASVDLGDVW